MRLMHATFAAAMLALSIAGEAAAQNAAVKDVKQQPAVSPLRYRFTHSTDGIMRLDQQSGQVVSCKAQASGKWLCEVSEEGQVLKAQAQEVESATGKLTEQLGMLTEERAALKAAIDKAQADSAAARSELTALRDEIAALKGQLSELAAMRKDIAALGSQLAAQNETKAQRAEITRLQNENESLKGEITALEDERTAMQKRIAELEPPRPPAPVPAPKSSELKPPQMPSKEELAQARAMIADAWRRVVEMLNDLRRDLTGKSDDSVRL